MNKSGTLYVVGTPIGNLEDITLRAVRILNETDLVAAEDTRRTLGLLNHLGIKKPLISYYEHNKKQRASLIIKALEEGKTVALVSDAGMPGISDPGEDLTAKCVEAGFQVTVVPGPTAVTAAMAVSGLDASGFYFGGFFPRLKKDRLICLERLADFEKTLIFYESPRRLLETLARIEEAWGDRDCCVAREMTKVHEEICRGSISKVREFLAARNEIKGEITFLIQGAPRTLPANAGEIPSEEVIWACYQQYLDQGMTKKDAGVMTAQFFGMNKKIIYQLTHRMSQELG